MTTFVYMYYTLAIKLKIVIVNELVAKTFSRQCIELAQSKLGSELLCEILKWLQGLKLALNFQNICWQGMSILFY